jgi:hypothetical protein
MKENANAIAYLYPQSSGIQLFFKNQVLDGEANVL